MSEQTIRPRRIQADLTVADEETRGRVRVHTSTVEERAPAARVRRVPAVTGFDDRGAAGDGSISAHLTS